MNIHDGPLAICDVCGWTYTLNELKKNWKGLMVCDKDFDERHPQDFLRPVREMPPPRDMRPEPEDVFVAGAGCTLDGRTAYPDYAIPDCAIPDWTPILGTRQAPLPVVVLDYPDLVVSEGVRGYWRLGEASGVVAADEIGGYHDGTYIGSPTLGVAGLINGDLNTACSFSGSSQRVDINNTGSIRLNENFSLEAWFKTSVSGQNTFFISSWRQSDSTGHGIGIYLNNIRAIYDGGGDLDIYTPQIYDGMKHHVVATYTGSSPNIVVRLYLDGVLVGISSTLISVTNNSPFIRLAAAGDASLLYIGVIDEVAIYSGVLTPAQILAHYNLGL